MLSHKGTRPIETQRLILRCFVSDDAQSMFSNWASDYDVCKYMRWASHKNIDETRATISSWNNSYDRPYFYQWAIALKDVNMPIGAIGLFVINEYDLTGDVGFCIGKEYWGRGIATEALRAVLYFAFHSVGFNRIETYHSINNPASGKVMQKAGMTFEGFAKQKYKSSSGFEDSRVYSIIKEDFK